VYDAVKADLETAELFTHQGLLSPVPGQTHKGTQELLKMAADTLRKALEDLLAVAKQGGCILREFGLLPLNAAVSQLVATARTNPAQLGALVKMTGGKFLRNSNFLCVSRNHIET